MLPCSVLTTRPSSRSARPTLIGTRNGTPAHNTVRLLQSAHAQAWGRSQTLPSNALLPLLQQLSLSLVPRQSLEGTGRHLKVRGPTIWLALWLSLSLRHATHEVLRLASPQTPSTFGCVCQCVVSLGRPLPEFASPRSSPVTMTPTTRRTQPARSSRNPSWPWHACLSPRSPVTTTTTTRGTQLQHTSRNPSWPWHAR